MKSILITDTPRNCQECICSGIHQDFDGLRDMCRFTCLELTGENMVQNRPEWCPLKPMPEKRVLPHEMVDLTNYGEEPWFTDGWNACLDEIMGETE